VKTFSVGPVRERFQEVPCPLCGSRRRRPAFRGRGCRFAACRACCLVYQNPQPVFEDLKGRYGQAYFQYEIANEDNFHRLMELGLADVDFAGRTAGFPSDRRFLDVGCATGRLLEAMRERGWQVRGVDLCPESAAYAHAHRGVQVFTGTLGEARFPAASFHAVHFSHLIEHVPSPRGLLAEVRRILRPGGLAVVTTPNVDGLQARLFRGLWRSAIADHLTLFSVRTLRRLLEESGFRILAVQTWGGLAKGTAPSWLKGPVDRWAKRRGHGDVVLMLARPRG
jgi:2-polyprenyl-3-methyl-5-hydroxy-6-metoxy-1,4-benzoquinol methylase